MDVIFCRNVLMYFTASQAQKVVQNLRGALVDDGWLAVSPSEGSQALCSRFVPVNFPGAILYQKDHVMTRSEPCWTPKPFDEATTFAAPLLETRWSWTPPMPASPAMESPSALPAEEPARVEPSATPSAVAAFLYEQGRYAEVVEILLKSFTTRDTPNPPAFSLLARALANQGKLTDAQAWCDRWVAADKLDASGHYLRAIVLQELGDNDQARLSFQRALYLQPDFVLAHFALGNLASNHRKDQEADKHFTNASHLLRDCQPGDLLPESDGLTAGRLTEIIASFFARRTAR
jgi:chemotaxis protein methyltransferase CheR